MSMITQSKDQQAGFTLLELLVAMTIFAVGLLGLSAMQGMALRGNDDAFLKGQAVMLANDIADRMRVNLGGVTAGAYAGAASPAWPAAPPNPGVVCVGAGAFCNNGAMAAFDIYQWLTNVSQLPRGTASISAAGPPYIVTINWDGRYGPSTYSVSVQP